MPLHLEIIPDLSRAVAPLAALLRAPVPDPFAPEWVVAPSQGVHRWLAEQLAEQLGTSPQGRDGIAANIRFAFPGALVAQALGGRMADDPWEVGRLTGTVLHLLHRQEALVPEGWNAGTLVAFARQVADRFDRYHVHRHVMIRAWAAGEDVLTPVRGAAALPVPEAQRWQPALWRAVREQLGVPSPPERVAQALAAITTGAPPAGLPGRIMLVGSSALAPLHLEVLLALAHTVEVHAWLVHPSPGVLHATLERLRDEAVRPLGWRDPQDDHPLRAVAKVPLLDSWLRPAQGMQRQRAVRGVSVTPLTHVEPAPATRLARLQALIRDDAPPTGTPAPPVLADQTVRLHGCHGPARQVEVLREALWHAFRELPALRPEEVLIVAPDLPGMAPHLEAVFGTVRPGAGAEPGQMPVVVADRSLREVNVVAEALVRLLDAAMGRAGVADLRALTDLAVVRARFGVDADTVARWMTWAERAGVAWGLSGAHREPVLPASFTVHSWAHAAQRLAVGALLPDGARPGDHPGEGLASTIPARGVDAEDLPQIGALLALLGELQALAAAVRGAPRPIGAWCDLLHQAVAATCAVTREQQPQLAATLGMLQALAAEATGCDVPVPYADWHPLLLERLVGTPGQVVLRGGAITATSLVPLRGVPYRVVCLVGLDEGALVRVGGDGDDLLQEQPLLGDPDPSGEQRQALLETVLAARERLIVTYSAHDVRSGKAVPAIAPLAELRELLQQAGVPTTVEEDKTVPDVQVRHPRHAIDARTFTPGALGCAGAFGHQEAQRDAVGRSGRVIVSERASADAPGNPPSRITLSLEELADFLDNPVSLFVRRALGGSVYDKVETDAATIPLVVDDAELGALAEPLLQRIEPWTGSPMKGRDAWLQSGELLRPFRKGWHDELTSAGGIPPEPFGTKVIDQTLALVQQLHFQCRAKGIAMRPGTPRRVSIMAGDMLVEGDVPGVHDCGNGTLEIIQVGTGRHTERRRALQRAMLWALALQHPDHTVTSFWIGAKPKDPGRTFASRGTVPRQDSDGAREKVFRDLMPLVCQALAYPFPLFGETSKWLGHPTETEARGAFRKAVKELASWSAEARCYGLTPEFDEVYQERDKAVQFFRDYHEALNGVPAVETSDATKVHHTWPRPA